MKLTEEELSFVIKSIILYYKECMWSDHNLDEKLIMEIIKNTEIVGKSIID
jgi:hypothetical protein